MNDSDRFKKTRKSYKFKINTTSLHSWMKGCILFTALIVTLTFTGCNKRACLYFNNNQLSFEVSNNYFIEKVTLQDAGTPIFGVSLKRNKKPLKKFFLKDTYCEYEYYGTNITIDSLIIQLKNNNKLELSVEVNKPNSIVPYVFLFKIKEPKSKIDTIQIIKKSFKNYKF